MIILPWIIPLCLQRPSKNFLPAQNSAEIVTSFEQTRFSKMSKPLNSFQQRDLTFFNKRGRSRDLVTRLKIYFGLGYIIFHVNKPCFYVMFSEANGSRSTLAMEKKEGTLGSEAMEMTEKGMKEKVFFYSK
jgi:hypothetical protein